MMALLGIQGNGWVRGEDYSLKFLAARVVCSRFLAAQVECSRFLAALFAPRTEQQVVVRSTGYMLKVSRGTFRAVHRTASCGT